MEAGDEKPSTVTGLVGAGDDRPLTVTGFTWADLRPRLRIRQLDEDSSRLVPAVGFRLAYRADARAERWCIGRPASSDPADDGAPTDCLNRAKATEYNPNSRYCVSCAVDEAMVASSLHHAHMRDHDDLDPTIRDHLAQPNVLYLAGFRDGSIKVGTSTAHRIDVRLAEQGAWSARLVGGAANGFVVRRLEDDVTSELDLPQSVAVGRKLSGLARPVGDDHLDRLLDEALDSVRSLDSITGEVAGHGFHPEIHVRGRLLSGTWRNPGFDRALWHDQPLYPYPASLDDGAHDVTIIGLCGRVAAITRPDSDDRFLADIGRWFGVELHPGRYEPTPITVQGALF